MNEENLLYKIKISVLWIFADFSLLLLLTLNGFDTNGGMKQMISGFSSQLMPLVLLGGAIVLLAPLIMSFLTLSLKYPTNRRVNIVIGPFFAILLLFAVAYGLSQASIETAYLTLMSAAAFVASSLIVWYAYSWPNETSGEIRRPRKEAVTSVSAEASGA